MEHGRRTPKFLSSEGRRNSEENELKFLTEMAENEKFF